MDRKYRQRGYQDSGRPERETSVKKEKPPGAPRTVMSHERPRSPTMAPRRGVSRCAGCGTILPADVDANGQCPRCHFELHSCKQCVFFDAGQRFECLKPIPERIAKKDARNECALYQMRVTVEKETSSAHFAKPATARQAFEDLFRK